MNKRTNSKFREIWYRLLKNRAAVFGLIIIVLLAICAIFADFITPYENAIKQDGSAILNPPSADHWFGTDCFGRDVFARIVHGSRVSLSIGIVSTIISVIIGGFLGAIAAFYGKAADMIIMRIMDIVSCIPPILLALAIVASLGPSLINLVIAIVFATVPSFVRLVRSVMLSVADQEYVEAAKSFGSGDMRVIFRHVIPNAVGPIIVQGTMSVSTLILAAAGLSFIGMGVQPPTPEWGYMLSEAREYMRTAPYLLYFPGCFILMAALAFNLLGDGLRDALDPKLKD